MMNSNVHINAISVFILICVLFNVNGCLLGGWDFLSELTEELNSICPIFEKTSSILADLFQTSSFGKFNSL